MINKTKPTVFKKVKTAIPIYEVIYLNTWLVCLLVKPIFWKIHKKNY